MINAFVTGDFSIKYVAHSSDSVQPLFYKITSYWGGLDGSIMFWVFLLSAFGAIAVYVNRERYRELIPYVVATISAVQMFFLYLTVVHKNPFSTFLTGAPPDGEGLSPLLQNFYMAIHPPSLYIGFVGMTIPFAFGIAALITGLLDDSWLRAVRRWTMFAWLFLSIGLFLGMIWAYEELGWGGYWMWDPVENAALLPWFTATAFLHSVMVQERRSMLRVWNVTLVITTFFLTIFGTFMTRSGVVQSVHAFGDDPMLAKLFTGFMVTILTFSFGLVIYRLPLLKARNELDSWASREAAFLVNNWILLFAAMFVLFGTMFPTLSEAVTGERLTVAAPFFNKWMAPVGLALLILTGSGPLLAWRKSALKNLRDSFMWPIAAGVAVGGVVMALGIPLWAAGLCFALCGFVVGTIVQEFWRAGMIRRKNTGTDIVTAIIGLVGRNKAPLRRLHRPRRRGVHLPRVCRQRIEEGSAGPPAARAGGEARSLRDPQRRREGERRRREADGDGVLAGLRQRQAGRHAVSGEVVLPQARAGTDDGSRHPAHARRGLVRRHGGAARGEGSVGQPRDLHQPAGQLDLDWVRRHRARHRHRAVARARLLVRRRALAGRGRGDVDGCADAGVRAARRHHDVRPAHAGRGVQREYPELVLRTQRLREAAAARDRLHVRDVRSRQHRRVPQGSLRHVASDARGTRHADRPEEEPRRDHSVVRDQVRRPADARRPIDKGFARLAWLVPYLVGASGAVMVGFAAVRWSRRPEHAAEAAPAVDAEIDERINDELRDLD
jgi:c-type cytochrome biogenesis protein CcmF